MSWRAAEMIAAQFDAIAAAAEGCDTLVASGLFPSTAAAQSVAEQRGICYVYATFCPVFLPSPHHRPYAYTVRPHPSEVTDNRVLWDVNVQTMNALFGEALNAHRSSIGLPPVDNVRDHVFTDRPWLASDPTLSPWRPTELDVVQTGAWILPDQRPLPAGLVAFLDAGAQPVYVGFGSIPMHPNVARVAIKAIRAQGRRAVLASGWSDLAPIDDRDDCFMVGEVNQQALFGRVAAVVQPWRRGHYDDGHTGGRVSGGCTPSGGPAILGRTSGRPGYRRGTRRCGSDPVESLSVALRTALTPEARARATAVARTIRSDGATVAAKLLLNAISRARPPGSA